MNNPISALPLGEILVKEGLLSPDATAKILRKQEQNATTGRPHKLFGQLCVEMKLLGRQQLLDILKKYKKGILLGELLVSQGLLTRSQLKQTLEIQQKYPKHRVGAILVKLGAISEDQLADALSQQLDIPKFLPTPADPALDRIGSLDPEFVRQNQFVPISEAADGLTVALADPINDVLLEYLTQSFSCRVIPVIASAGAIKSVVETYYKKKNPPPAPPVQAVRKASAEPEEAVPELRVTMLGPLEVPIDVQREIDKAGKTHGLDFMDSEDYQGIAPRRGADPLPEEADPAFKLKEQKTLIERWPFLLMTKEEEAAERAKRPSGPSIDEILMEKFGMTEDMDLTSTFVLSNRPTEMRSPASDAPVDLKSTVRFGTLQGNLSATLKAAENARSELPALEEIPEDTLMVSGVGLAAGQVQTRQEDGMINYLIKSALLDQATAIYIEPQDKYLRVRYRIDGVLHQKTALPQNLSLPMLARLKQLGGLDAANLALPQHNRVEACFNSTELELSIATYPNVWGESMALNFKYKQDAQHSAPLQLDGIGLSPLHLWRLQKLLGKPGGLLLVTGPARSGKTTTLYSACNYLNVLSQLIVTAESPVEQTLTGLLQGNWTPTDGGSFGDMIQAMGYMNPEVMMVGEVVDSDTVKAGVELALSGAKVMTSYQSFDTMGALQRLMALGLESYLVASGHMAVLSQRLVRKLCPHCKREDQPSRESLDLLGLLEVDPTAFPLFRPKGCEQCHYLGYHGQLAIHELLVINETLREAILKRQPASVIREIARSKSQLISMAEDGYFKATQGLTSLAEIQRVAFVNEYDASQPLTAEILVGICQAEDKAYL